MFDVGLIKTTLTQGLGRGIMIGKKFAPEILTTVGVLGVVTAGVLGAKATLELEPLTDRIKEHAIISKDRLANGDISKQEHTKALAEIYTVGAMDLVKLYGPAISLGLGSIACIVGAHGIMRRRNVALIAAYNVLEKGYNEYRSRVIEEFGPEKDRDYRLGLKDETVINEKGKAVKVTTVNPNGHSPYARFFDESSSQWSKDAEMNQFTLQAHESFLNQLLVARGHVFLNEVYDALDIPRTKAGAVVGWVISKDGDNFIDFGMYNFDSEPARAFVNGYERSILLDFNVDGIIYDKI